MVAVHRAEATGSQRKTILVADDDVLVRLDLADELRGRGYVVIEAANADEALSILQGGVGIDLLLTDIRMPGATDGLGLARRVNADFPFVKVVLVSAERPSRETREAMDGFFSKPCDVERLAEHAGRLLSESR